MCCVDRLKSQPKAAARHRLIFNMRNSREIPWKRISIESAAIVASILLAFAIDAWWNNVQQTRELRTTLASFESGFRDHLKGIDQAIETTNAEVEALQSFLLAEPNEEAQISNPADLQRFFLLLFRPGTFDVSDSVLVATLDARSLIPLNSPPLEAAIAQWLGELAELREDRNALRVASQSITLALTRHSEVRNFMALDREDRFGISVEAMRQLHNDEELLSQVAKKLVAIRFQRSTLRTLRERGDEVVKVIKETLDE